jgi:hypothetical protein
MKKIALGISIIFGFSLISATMDHESILTDQQLLNATKHLEAFSKVNDQPQFILSAVAGACAPSARMADGIHDNKYINVYINEKGFEDMTGKKKPRFAIGTMILKEKMGLVQDSVLKQGATELFTIMIKREKGYNADCGDWEFASLDVKTSKIERGKISSCQHCHTSCAETDFVFRTNYLGKQYADALK